MLRSSSRSYSNTSAPARSESEAVHAPTPVPSGGARPTFAAPSPPVIQRITGGERLEDIATDVRNVEQLSSEDIALRMQHLTTHRHNMHWADPRQTHVNNMMHVLSRQQLTRQMNRPHMITRVLGQQQLVRENMGVNTVRTSEGSMGRNLGTGLHARGGGKDRMSRFYSFMRKYGGAGYQGFHSEAGDRPRNVHSILNKIGTDRPVGRRRGAKMSMVAVDRRMLRPEDLVDTNDPATTQEFLRDRYRFRKMYRQHASEGVVGHSGKVPLKAIKGLRSFRLRRPGQPDQKTLRIGTQDVPETISREDSDRMLDQLLDMASSEPEPTFQLHGKYYRPPDDEHDRDGDGMTT